MPAVISSPPPSVRCRAVPHAAAARAARGDAEPLPLLELARPPVRHGSRSAVLLLPLVGVARAADAPPSAALAAATVYAAGDAAASDAPLLAPTTLVNLGVLAASLYRAWAAAAAPAEAYDADSPNLRGADRLFDFDARLRERGRK